LKPYESVLDPRVQEAARGDVCALAVMAKAPRAGKVKTRLAPPLTLEQSAALNKCFLRDTARNIAGVAGGGLAAGLICYTPVGDEIAFDGLLPEGFALIAQRGDGFGERLLAAAEDILACGFGAVCLIDSDSPTMPAGALQQAVEELARPGDRVVLGGSEDGGYYLIGMKQAHAAAFEKITWSTGSVYAETVGQVREAGIELVELPVWYDVDDGATLAVLEAELLEGVRPAFAEVDGYDAQATREFLMARRGGHASHSSAMKPRMDGAPGTPLNRDKAAYEWATRRAWLTNVALIGLGCGLVWLARQFVVEHTHFAMGFSGVSERSAVLYVAAVAIVLTQPVNRWTLWIAIAFAVAMRAMTLFAEPFLSSDIYRYVWDGIVQHAAVNPYRYVPGDAALTFLRAPHRQVFDNINRRDYAHTIYPPVAQMIYWAGTFFSPTVQAMKVAMFGFECVTVGALLALLRLMGRRSAEVLLYAWCPLLVWEIGGAGHVDAAVMAFVTLALLFRYKNSPVLTGVFLACAVLTKFYPLVLLPALYQRRDWKMPAVMVGMSAAAYAVYSSVGKAVFGFAGGYAKEEGIETGTRYFLLQVARRFHGLRSLSVGAYVVFCAVVMGGISWWAWRRAAVEVCEQRRDPTLAAKSGGEDGPPMFLRVAMGLGFGMMLLFSPHYPWYVVWLIPFFVLAPNLPVLAYLMAFFYLFTTVLADGTVGRMFVLNEILYGVVVVAVVVQVMWRWCASGRVRRVLMRNEG